jgi:hypothetical protein
MELVCKILPGTGRGYARRLETSDAWSGGEYPSTLPVPGRI